MLLVIHIQIALAMAGAACQAPDVCKLFTRTEIAAVVGSEASDGQALLPGTCSWNGKGANLSISRSVLEGPEAAMMVEARKAGAVAGDTVKDEPGVGQRAMSDLASNKRTLTLLASEGPVLWTFTLAKGDQPVDVDAALPRLRDLAKKGISAR